MPNWVERETLKESNMHSSTKPFAILAILVILGIIAAGVLLRELELFGAGLFGALILAEILLLDPR